MSVCFRADGRYMILGGQHIAGACKMLREKLMAESGAADDSGLPEAYRNVRGVVLKVATPLHALVQAAGFHQSTQQDVFEVTFADVCRFFVRASEQKQLRGGEPGLTDDEVVSALQALGLIRGDKEIMNDQEKMGMSSDEAADHLIRVKYNATQKWRSTARFAVANQSNISALLTKMEEFNKVKQKEVPPFRAELFREKTGLLVEDYKDLGNWILARTKLAVKDLAKQFTYYKKRRCARWHIYSAPEEFVHPQMKNEEGVNLLIEMVNESDMSAHKWGGQVWKKLKEGKVTSPGWDRLHATELWQNVGKYRAVHKLLNLTADQTKTDMQSVINAERGSVVQTQLDIVDHQTGKVKQTKQVMVGAVMGLLAVSMASAVIF